LLTYTLKQKFHLIGKHISVSQDKAFVKVGRIGDEEWQMPPVMRLAIAFRTIAAFASGKHIGPHVLPALGDRAHMIGCEFVVFEAQPAVSTKTAITAD
jgi:hypothetical protein